MTKLQICEIVAISVANVAIAGSVSFDGVSSSANNLNSYWTNNSRGESYLSAPDKGKLKYSSIEIHEAGTVGGGGGVNFIYVSRYGCDHWNRWKYGANFKPERH